MQEHELPKAPLRLSVEADVPPEISEAVVPIMEELSDLVAPWYDQLWIRWKSSNDSLAEVKISEHYRWAVLTITGQWLDLTPDRRKHTIIHELMHLVVHPICYLARGLLEKSGGDSFADERLEEANERVVSDMTYMIARLKGIIITGLAPAPGVGEPEDK